MKRVFFLIMSMVSVFTLSAEQQDPLYLSYIEQWKGVAIDQQNSYGIPASITLAQGLLESSAGQSELAIEANNHFGIKCNSEWMGGVYYHDDDEKGECFRQYGDAGESFKDHSIFLQRSRYQSLYEIAVEDYEGWAKRLKECGYATDPTYAKKLVHLIELYRLDTVYTHWADLAVGSFPEQKINHEVEEPVKAGARQDHNDSIQHRTTNTRQSSTKQSTGKQPSGRGKAVVVTKNDNIATISSNPEPEYVEPLSASKEKEQFYLQHPKKKENGITYIEAKEGDTYANVAFRLNVRERQLRENNDALGRDLAVGDRIYLSPKSYTVPEEKTYLWVHPGESLWFICQREAIQMKKVQELNGFDKSLRTFTTRQQILLRKPKKEK